MSPGSLRDLFSNNQFGFSNTDLVLLLDEYDFPALLFNSRSKEIFCGNKHFVELSGIGNSDLVHLKIDKLLMNEETEWQNEQTLLPMQLMSKNGTRISVSCELKYIVENGKISLLKLSSNAILSRNLSDRDILEGIQSLFIRSIRLKPSELLVNVIEEAGKLFQNQPITIYISENNQLRIIDSGKYFPETLPYSEFERIKAIDFWAPGKRILCDIHRVGRQKGLKGLLTVPLTSEHLSGLLIAGVDSEEFFVSNQEKLEKFFYWVCLLLDLTSCISELRAEISSLMNHLTALQMFEEHASDMLLIVNEKSIVEHVNKPLLRMMGYSSYEVINHQIKDFIDAEKVINCLNDPEIYEKTKECTVPFYDRMGKKYTVSFQIEKLESDDKIKRLIILSDITRTSQLKKSLTRLEKQSSLGESIADFAHDARNPLNNISTGLQMLRKIYEKDEALIDAVDRMQSDCIRMSDLLESVLSFSRQNTEEFTRIDLSSLIGNIFKRFENKFENKNIQTSLQSIHQPLYTLGDLRSLERVFINLINNSIESMEKEGGELSILIKENPRNAQEIEITIADSGPGIPKEILERIFEPYVSGKKTGTGLGLAIIKKIIDAHQGKIAIESYTSGTIFSIILNKDL